MPDSGRTLPIDELPATSYRLTMPPARARLPHRREAITEEIAVSTPDGGETRLMATVGLDPATGAAREVFLSGARDGSMLAAILDDASVVISVALQHGVPLAALAKSVRREPHGSVVGAALAMLERIDAEFRTPATEEA